MYGSRCVIFYALFLVIVLINSVEFSFGAPVPQIIHYQGTLANQDGAAVADGNYIIEFNIYDVATGGTALWTEKWDASTSQVQIVEGGFNLMLGSIVPIPADFFAVHPVAYLGIKVGSDAEMVPRQRVASVGYAFAAGNGVPKGGIIMWSGAVNQIPDGWALCDGANGTPDLRARFVVGAGNTYAVGATGGEAAHVLTIAEVPVHDHGVNDPGHRHTLITNGGTTSSGNFANVSGGNPDQYTQYATTGITIRNSGGGQAHNNLPPYYALAFIMKL